MPPVESIRKLVVFTGDPSFSIVAALRSILDEFDDVSIDVLIHRPKRKFSDLLRSQFRNLKKHGVSWMPYLACEVWSRLAFRRTQGSVNGTPVLDGRYDLVDLVAKGRVRVTELSSINGPDAQRLIEKLAPDLGLSLAAPILKERVFGVPRLGTINLHQGRVPDYRGMPPAFWEILNREKSVGCTIHKVLSALDSGPVLAETEVPIEKFSTPAGMRILLDSVGNALLVDAIRRLRDGKGYMREQAGKGKTNRRPPLTLERTLRRRLAKQEGTSSNTNIIKDITLTGYSTVKAAGRYIRPASSPQKVVVLLYHRVNDALRDNVTVGIERFDQHMAYLKRYWPVVPLRAVIRGEVEPVRRKPLVCVTFDDGYRDNYDYAAPILQKHRLPATFFVSTGKLTHQAPFDHDVQSNVLGLPNMNWDQVREMQSAGLDFGSHTVNHVNLAQVTLDEAKHDLIESRETIRKELGHEEFLFAYPYGKRTDISSQVRDLVRESAYLCCCSAYGGINDHQMDLFNILRTGVNYNFSLAALRSRLNGWD